MKIEIGEITIATTDGPRKTPAFVFGVLAVNENRGGFKATHVESGLAFGPAVTGGGVFALLYAVREIGEMDIDWSFASEVDYRETGTYKPAKAACDAVFTARGLQ